MEGTSEGTMAAVGGHDCGANMSLSLSSSGLTVVQSSTLLKNDEFRVFPGLSSLQLPLFPCILSQCSDLGRKVLYTSCAAGCFLQAPCLLREGY